MNQYCRVPNNRHCSSMQPVCFRICFYFIRRHLCNMFHLLNRAYSPQCHSWSICLHGISNEDEHLSGQAQTGIVTSQSVPEGRIKGWTGSYWQMEIQKNHKNRVRIFECLEYPRVVAYVALVTSPCVCSRMSKSVAGHRLTTSVGVAPHRYR